MPRRAHHVLSGQYLPKQVPGPSARLCMPRRFGFIAHGFGRGFTAPCRRALRRTLRPSRLLMQYLIKRHVSSPSFSFGPSSCLLAEPAPTTTTFADFWLHLLGCRAFTHKARSPQVRTRSFTAQPPHLRRLAFGHKSFAVDSLLALAGVASNTIRVPRLTVYAPRFLSTLGHPRSVAFHLPRCGQLGRGLAPRRSRPCWAHKRSRV